MKWQLGIAVLLAALAGAPPLGRADASLADRGEIERYLREFDRKAHASAADLRGELASPLLLLQPLAAGQADMRTVGKADLDKYLDCFPPTYVLKKVAAFPASARLAVGCLTYSVGEIEAYITLMLARDGSSWKTTAVAMSMPVTESAQVAKFLKEFDKAAHGGAAAAVPFFQNQVHRIDEGPAAPGAGPDVAVVAAEQAGQFLHLPLPASLILHKQPLLTTLRETAWVTVETAPGGRKATYLLMLANAQDGWKIVGVARDGE